MSPRPSGTRWFKAANHGRGADSTWIFFSTVWAVSSNLSHRPSLGKNKKNIGKCLFEWFWMYLTRILLFDLFGGRYMHCTSSWLYHILPYLGKKGWVGHQTKTGWSWNCFAKSLLLFDCSSSFWIGGLRSLWNDWWLWIEHDYWFMIYDVYGKAGWSPICSSYSAETTQVTWWYR